jgi:hypothetical protein
MSGKFKCEYCKQKFNSNYVLDKHINKKDSCASKREEWLHIQITKLKKYFITRDKCVVNEDKKCLYCKNNFSTKGNLKAHITGHCEAKKSKQDLLQRYQDELITIKERTSERNEENQEEDQIDNQLNQDQPIANEDEIRNLDREALIKIILDKQPSNNNPNNTNNTNTNTNTNTQNNNNNSNNTNTNTNNIQTQNNVQNQQNITNVQITLNNYDQPNCDFLTIEQKNKFLKDRYKGLIDFITYVYFNEAYPENHTILYTNLRSKYGQIFKNNKWMIEEIDQIADKLNEYSFDKLNEHLDEIKKDDESAEKYKKEIDKGLAFVKHFTSNDTTKQSKSDIKKTLYNNKDLIEKTKKVKKVDL